jgi:CheY-like chemotaxis protein
VEDTGVGITEDELDKVFKYFEQTASGRAEKSGTGLGLAISRDFARMMGGDITVASVAGKGSTFRLEVVIKESSVSDVKEEIQPRRVIGLEVEQEIPRILVAEDKEESRSLLVKLLQTVGFDVREAVNGEEAIEIFKKWHPDFIWMDVRMPEMDGLQAARYIKDTEVGKSTIVAALTAHALEEEKEEILAAGCDDFVRKPFREQDIFDVMARQLDLKYMYEGEKKQVEPVQPGIESYPEQFAALPADLLSRLHQAVVELDTARTLTLIEQITEQDASIGSIFRKLARKLDYDSLLKLLEGEDIINKNQG